jgi:hypothetical protein
MSKVLHRQLLEQELIRQNLPSSTKGIEQGDKDLDILRHLVKELNGFEGRIGAMRDSFVAMSTSGVLKVDSDDNDTTSNMAIILGMLEETQWMDSDGPDTSFSSTLYRLMLELLEEIKSLD